MISDLRFQIEARASRGLWFLEAGVPTGLRCSSSSTRHSASLRAGLPLTVAPRLGKEGFEGSARDARVTGPKNNGKGNGKSNSKGSARDARVTGPKNNGKGNGKSNSKGKSNGNGNGKGKSNGGFKGRGRDARATGPKNNGKGNGKSNSKGKSNGNGNGNGKSKSNSKGKGKGKGKNNGNGKSKSNSKSKTNGDSNGRGRDARATGNHMVRGFGVGSVSQELDQWVRSLERRNSSVLARARAAASGL